MNNITRIAIVAALIIVVGAVLATKQARRSQTDTACCPTVAALTAAAEAAGSSPSAPATAQKLPRLVDVGAGKCIPCKLMAPILAELKRDYADRFTTEFVDVWENPDAGKPYNIQIIPTQVFFDAEGRERFRHEGFFGKQDILAKWKELGVNLSGKTSAEIVRETPLAADARPRDQVCFMCDGDVNPKTRTLVQGETEQRTLCSPHCYFIYFSSVVGADPKVEAAKVNVTDWASGQLAAATSATFLYGMDAKGRPTIKAFANKAAATTAQQAEPGNLVPWDVLRAKELATRCAFCDRAVYPEDACAVKIGERHGYGCCTHCSLGVAARLKEDIEVEAKDGFSGEPIRVRTFDGKIAELAPATAVAWFGQKRNPEGQWVSAGCFKQGFFMSQDTLKKWLEARPAMTGRQITMAQALADKMKLSPEQIAKACKLGECK